MSQQLANGKQQFIDGNGNPLAGGSVAFYLPGTLTPTNTWQDSGLTVLNANPVVLDANGEATIWGADGTFYRQVVTDALGNTIWDEVVGLVYAGSSDVAMAVGPAAPGTSQAPQAQQLTDGSLPIDATAAPGGTPFALRNRVINGDMRVAQRGTSFTGVNADPVYTLDRWRFSINSGVGFTVDQASDAPAGFTNSLLATVTAPSAGFTTGQYTALVYCPEGADMGDLGFGAAGAQDVTISFWAKSSLAGTFPFAVGNASANRSYVTTYSLPTANTWTKVTITIPGDTAGTWYADYRGWGLLTWDLGDAATSETATLDAWQAGNYTWSAGVQQVGLVNGATFQLTGVQLEAGSTATPFERRPLALELSLCQRYFYSSYQYGTAPGTASQDSTALSIWCPVAFTSSAYYAWNVSFPVGMRTNPTINLYNPHTGATGSAWMQNAANSQPVLAASQSSASVSPYLNAATVAQGDVAKLHLTASSEL